MICSYGILFCEKKCSGYQLMSWNPLFGMLLHRLFQQWLKWHPPKKLFSNQGWSLKGAHLPWPLSGFWKEIPLSQRIGIALCHRPLMGAFLRICWVGGDSVCWCSLINVLSIRSFPGFYVFFPFCCKIKFFNLPYSVTLTFLLSKFTKTRCFLSQYKANLAIFINILEIL